MTERSLFDEQITGIVEAADENIPADYEERDEILRKALQWMGENCTYVPLDVEEDINLSYVQDSLEDFRETVRGWLRALRDRTRSEV